MVFGLFSKGFDPDAFEKDLTGITDSISKTQSQVARLQSRGKQLRSHLVRILAVSYVLLNAFNYAQVPRGIVGKNRVQIYLKGLTGSQLVVLGAYPFVGYALVWLLGSFFKVLTSNRTTKLKSLRKKHAAKIDELKKITNFNTTNRLLNKYGAKEEAQTAALNTQKPNEPRTKLPATVKHSNLNEKQKQEIAKLNLGTSGPIPSIPSVPGQSNNIPPGNVSGIPKQPTGPRTIQDRLLDILIGSDNSESVEKRFALICSNCYTHNGLAPPNSPDPAQVKYLCFKCGTLNGSSAWDQELKKLKEEAPEIDNAEEIVSTEQNPEQKTEQKTEEDVEDESVAKVNKATRNEDSIIPDIKEETTEVKAEEKPELNEKPII